MNDTNDKSDETIVRVPRLVGADGHTPVSRRNQQARKQRPPTTAEVQEWITAGSIAGMKKVYEQLTEENAKLFQQLEQTITERVTVEIRRMLEAGEIKLLDGRL